MGELPKITIHYDRHFNVTHIDTHGERFIVRVPGQAPRVLESKSSGK